MTDLLRASAALRDCAAWLASTSEPGAFLRNFLREVARHVGGAGAAFFRFDPAMNTLGLELVAELEAEINAAAPGEQSAFEGPVPANITLYWQRLLERRRALVIDAENPADEALFWPGTRAWHLQTGKPIALGVALMLGDEPLGFLGVTFRGRVTISEEQVALLETVAHQAALAFRLTRMGEQLQEAAVARERALAARARSEALARIGVIGRSTLQRLADHPVLDAFLGHVLTAAVEHFGAAGGGVWRYDAADQVLRLLLVHEDGELHSPATCAHPGRGSIPWLQADPEQCAESFRKGRLMMDGQRELAERPGYATCREYFERRGIKAVLCVPMFLGEEYRGTFSLRFTVERSITDEEEQLAFALANQAVLALEMTRLAEQVRNAAVTEERNRLARDIHDSLAQGFTGVIVQLQAAGFALHQRDLDATLEHLGAATELARRSLEDARRSVAALRPRALDGGAELQSALAELVTLMTSDTAVEAVVRVHGNPRRLPPAWEDELLRIGQEALTNTLRHAAARRFTVELSYGEDHLLATFADDGAGLPAQQGPDGGYGLVGMRERAARIGAELKIDSDSGGGTRVSVRTGRLSSLGREAAAAS